MNKAPDDWEAQLIDYSIGAMDPADAAEFEARLEECRTHVQVARHYTEVVGLLGSVVPHAEPPEGHKNRMMARIASTPQERSQLSTTTQPSIPKLPTLKALPPVEREPSAPASTSAAIPTPRVSEQPSHVTNLGEYRARRASSTRIMAALGAIAAALILFVGIWGWSANDSRQKAEQQLAQLRSEQVSQAQRITDLEAQLSTIAARPNIPEGYKALNLAAQPEYSTVSALAIYNPDRNDVIFIADGLQQLPQDKVYELWLLKPQGQGNPDKGGTFNADATGSARHSSTASQAIAQYVGFAVTIEPAPGVEVATGPAVVVGTYH